MKRILLILAFLVITVQLWAQSNASVRLALISENDQAATAVDVLTAQFSSEPRIQLLERDQIAKVYREQGLSVANTDYLKLGQILGADGLLLLQTTMEGTNEFLNIRLVAVKPGVVLVAEKVVWPVSDPTGWSAIVAGHLDIFLPKLAVLIKDAIPVSVVNLRSAVNSSEAAETEQQLKLLTIQRLCREPQLFVLERQKMQLLTEEKDLKLDDSAFWNGSYLLEGVVDQNGYSKEIITINARLTPPKGGAPLEFEVSGSRTNLPEVVNQLVGKVDEALKLNSTVKEWNAADEAAQYYAEAQWAIKWGVYPEAQEAAESAWALGKRDLDCAMIRINTYASAIEKIAIGGGGIDQSLANGAKESDRDWVIKYIKHETDNNPGIIFAFSPGDAMTPISFVEVQNSPSSKNLDQAIRALDLYREFSQTLLLDKPQINPAWYDLGVECLTTAAQVLQHYYLVPQSRGEEVEKLAELRALARSVATWISKSPSVHDSYFVVDPNPDHEIRTLLYKPNIYTCELNWGCFWQEKPDDCIALYRELLSSPAFTYLNEPFGSLSLSPKHSEPRGLDRPRVIAWNEDDRKRIRLVWSNFVQELSDSTNQFLQAEAKLFETLDAGGLNETEIDDKYSAYWQKLKLGKGDTLANEAQKHLLTENSVLVNSTEAKAPVAMSQEFTNPGQQTINSKPAATSDAEAANCLFIKRFFNMPQEQFWVDVFVWPEEIFSHGIRNEKVLSHRWQEGRLLLDVRYDCNYLARDRSNYIDGTLGAAALLNPLNGHWDVTEYPRGGTLKYGSVEMFHGSLYLVVDDQSILGGNEVGHTESILKFNFESNQWETLNIQIPGLFKQTTINQDILQLFAVNDHLYAANYQIIVEITDDGRGTHFLASTRRRPAVSTLDLLDSLGSPVLFTGPGNTLRASIGSKIYSWDGKDWQEMFDFGFGSWGARLDIAEEGVIFRVAQPEWALFSQSDGILWVLKNDQTKPELCLYEKTKPGFPAANKQLPQKQSPVEQTPLPLWELPKGESLINSGAALVKSNLVFFDDSANRIVGPSGQGTTVTEKDGSARLVCLSPGFSIPIIVPLKFNWREGRPPFSKQLPRSTGDTWMECSGNTLYIGQPDTPGIWAVPVSEVETAIAAQKPK